jgi:hypothetical protein
LAGADHLAGALTLHRHWLATLGEGYRALMGEPVRKPYAQGGDDVSVCKQVRRGANRLRANQPLPVVGKGYRHLGIQP